MPALLDSNRLMYLLLTGNVTLCAAVGHVSPGTLRIFGPPLGIPSGMTAPAKYIVFANDGGPGNQYTPMGNERFQFYVYGATQTEARSVARSLDDALHRAQNQRVTLTAGSVALLRRADRQVFADLPEPEILWPRVVCAYSIVFCEWTFTA
jgi:hypothetical protein